MEEQQVRVIGVVAADCPDDGGKWMLMCEHFENGEWVNGGIIQDTNKRRLATWKTAKWDDGLTQWCPECQEMHWGESPR